MKSFIYKMFALSDIRYLWLLAGSMILFIISLYIDKINTSINGTLEWIYGISIACAFIWSILNYIDHIKINALYKKCDNIDAYVDSLAMSKKEKEDLRTYLNDFVKDLEANGKTKEEAVKTAIGQFQVQEFTSFLKNSGIFELPAHHYLLGYAVIFAAAFIFIQSIINAALGDIFVLHAISFMLILYSISFLGLIVLYKLLDVLVARKIVR
jgi:hypothetical protein